MFPACAWVCRKQHENVDHDAILVSSARDVLSGALKSVFAARFTCELRVVVCCVTERRVCCLRLSSTDKKLRKHLIVIDVRNHVEDVLCRSLHLRHSAMDVFSGPGW